jgi:hypothetical protein
MEDFHVLPILFVRFSMLPNGSHGKNPILEHERFFVLSLPQGVLGFAILLRGVSY